MFAERRSQQHPWWPAGLMLPNFIGSHTVSMIAPWSYKGDHEEVGSGVPKRCGTGGTSGHVVNVCLTVHSSLPVSRSRSLNPGRTSGAAGIQ